jgi:hypothetical protein
MTTATGGFTVSSWDEDTYAEIGDGRKLTRASVGQEFDGDIRGDGHVEWLMSYRDDGTARFVGLQQIEGRLADREGTFVVETIGDFDGKEAKGIWAVVPDSATGELTGLKGAGEFTAPMGGTPSFRLEYVFA